MEVFGACPDVPLRVLPSSSNFPHGVSSDYQRRVIEFISSVVSALLRNLFYAIIATLFGVVGMTIGATTALTGALFGLKSKRGFLHGAASGAIAGPYFSLEIFKASVGLWHSFANGPVSFLQFIEVISTVVNPTLLYLEELFGPVGNLDGVHGDDQVGTVEITNEDLRLIDARRANVSSRSSVHWLPKTRITHKDRYDAEGNRSSCPICLEDFQLGEVAGILPLCHHMFHRSCIAKWRTRCSSCPLCRQNQ